MADLIDRQAALDALAKQMPKTYTPDGSHPADEEIYKIQEIYVDCIESIEILPAVQPATSCSEIPNGSDDTISRQAAVDVVDFECGEWRGLAKTITDKLEALPAVQPEPHYPSWYAAQIEKLPAAQPEIIRCKDCKHYKIDHPKANGYHCCYRCHNIFPMKEDDFCSRAERRTDG